MKKVEWQLYCKMWDWLESNWCVKPDAIIYLNTPAEVCLKRIEKRNRDEETTIPIKYLQDLEKLHDEWLYNSDAGLDSIVITLDGREDWSPGEIHQMLVSRGIIN